jgi:diguanylate cyclase (GGDEF)-like protein
MRAFFIGYFLFLVLAVVSVLIARMSDNVAVFWPANATMVALALYFGQSRIFSILAATYIANATTQLLFGDNLIAIFGFPIANTLEVALVTLGFAWFGVRLGGHLTSNKALVMLAIVATAAVPAALVGSYIVLWVFSAPIGDTFLHWWAGDIVSSMIVFMPLMAFVRQNGIHSFARLLSVSKPVEWLVVAASSVFGFFVLVAIHLPPVVVLVFPLIWLGLKGRVFEVALVGSLLSLATSAAVVVGIWPEFSQNLTLRDAVFQQQTLALFCTFPTYLIAIAVDNLRQNQREVAERHDVLDTMLKHMNEGVSMFDSEGRLAVWNEKYLDTFGISSKLAQKGIKFTDLLTAQKANGDFHGDPEELQSTIFAHVNRSKSHRAETALETGRVIKTVHSPTPDGGWIGTHEDVTDKRLLERKLAYESRHDALTGLANRRFFDQKIAETTKLAQQQKHGLALFTIDLDNFKTINDTYGHDVGDGVLRWAANQLRLASDNDHFLARIGGDEFMLLMAEDGLSLDETTEMANAIVERLADPIDIGGKICVCGGSVGIAYAPQGELDRKQLMIQSDVALYAAKKSGRNRFRIFDTDQMDRSRLKLSAAPSAG